ncbi:hypothetical protein [Shimia sp. SDUM112013]|uniref:hypothetical protein n=1 Tax=Shimia sp. SDUM112013 TaxID=3136160 RepID=UPI0032EBB7D2
MAWRTEMFLRSDEQAHVPAALEAAILSFVGNGGSSQAEDIPSDFLTQPRPAAAGGGSSRVTYEQSRSRRVGGRLVGAARISGPLYFEGSAMMAYGQSNYRLPNGAGVLVQGIDIRFRTLSAELGATVVYRDSLFGSVPVSVGLGGGVLHAYTRTRVDSPVLRIREVNSDTLAFTSLRFGIRTPPRFGTDLGAVLELRNYATFGPSAALEVNLRF